MYCAQCENQLIKPTLNALEYVYTQQMHKISSNIFHHSMGAMPPSGSLHSGFSSAFEAVVHTADLFKSTTLTTVKIG
jgi:hypothetical protein